MNHTSNRVFQAFCFFIALLVISATGAFVFWSLEDSKKRYLNYTQQSIWAQIDIAQQAISSWLDYKITVTARFADSRYFRDTIKPLLVLDENLSWEELKEHPLQTKISTMFALHISQINSESYQLITPDQRVIASSNAYLLGEVTERLTNVPGKMEQIQSGNTAVFPLHRNVWKHHKDASLEIAAPIFDDNMKLIAILLMEFNATHPLTEIAHQANSASIGEICTTGLDGHFLSAHNHPSVYDKKLEHNLWEKVQNSEDSYNGKTLFRFSNQDNQPSYALLYKHPMLPLLLVGQTTRDEALVHYYQQRTQLGLLAFLVTGLCIVSLVLLIALNKRQLAKHSRLNIELEKRVNERTEALQIQSEQLATALKNAEAAIKTKSQFLANMSHEIRTPMNAIIGFTDVLRQSDLNQEQSKQILIVSRAAHSLLSLLNDILDLSKMEAGRIQFEDINFSMDELISDVVNTLSIKAEQKSLALNVSVAPDCQEYFIGDPGKITQVLINIVGNAIKFTQEGSVTLSVSRRAEQIVFAVKDTGIGISKDRQKAIFQAFTQADSSITRGFGGTGLGTTISRQIVELMGGTIELESEQYVGTTFTIRLTLPAGQPPINKAQSEVVHQYTHHLNVLYAEDIEENVELVRVWLKPYDHNIVVANNGQAAIDAFMAQSFDVILMDIQMPVLDGLSATRAIREHEQKYKLTTTPIIALSASVLKEEVDKSHQAGCSAFVTKPIDINQLLSTIESFIPSSKATPELLDSTIWESEDDLDSIDGIDIAAGIKIWRSSESYKKCLLSFAQKHNSCGDVFVELEALQDVEGLKAKLHSLQGVSGNLKIDSVYKPALELTKLICESSSPFESHHIEIKALIQLLAEELDAICQNINATLNAHRGDPSLNAKNIEVTEQTFKSRPILTTETQILVLKQLIKAIKSDNIETMEIAVRDCISEFGSPTMQDIEAAINQFDFLSALTQTEQLIQNIERQQ